MIIEPRKYRIINSSQDTSQGGGTSNSIIPSRQYKYDNTNRQVQNHTVMAVQNNRAMLLIVGICKLM